MGAVGGSLGSLFVATTGAPSPRCAPPPPLQIAAPTSGRNPSFFGRKNSSAFSFSKKSLPPVPVLAISTGCCSGLVVASNEQLIAGSTSNKN
jgi:hypothetical protein